ncbi:MAG: radical SAM protein [Planctomycetaceae bacterium]|nr:radical SAM protein [Planctomycetaceae bacterium]|tara:strand:- start:912 stop:1811 length:900 start_codon:yes stop_codon:yes gene_type:complete
MSTANVEISLSHLDELWFQVSGTRCNLTCQHCFISCSPDNDNFGFLTRKKIKRSLRESAEIGVKGYYFTGGEPFLHPEMTDILIDTLEFGPATVLTNATVFKEQWLNRLSAAHHLSRYSLEFRVSLDGFSSKTNDPIRGKGTFDRAIRGVGRLVSQGFLPIITATQTWPDSETQAVLERFTEVLKQHGYAHPRIKLLPTLKIGAEKNRTNGYSIHQRVTSNMLEEFDTSQLVCEHSRIVTDRGVHVCPILIESPESVLGENLKAASDQSFNISHGACFTCYQYGSICSNVAASNTPGSS